METSTLSGPAQVAPEEMTVGQLVEEANAGEGQGARDAMDELEARADDGVEEAKAALESLGADGGVTEPERADEEAQTAEQHDLDEAEHERQDALPEAADDDGSDVDLSAGVELHLPGLEGVRLSFQGIGGKRPEESELRIVGGGFKVPGQFEKGEDLHIELVGRVTEVAFSDVLDNKTSQAVTSKRKHKARVIKAIVLEKSQSERLAELTDAVHGFLDGTVSKSVLSGILGRDDDPDSLLD